jgi:hypothetical protein
MTTPPVTLKPTPVEGLHAYTQKHSVSPGDTIDFRVSSSVPYRFNVVRLRSNPNDNDPNSGAIIKDDETVVPVPSADGADWPAKQQNLHLGSYVHVETGLPSDATYTELTLECWVRPFDTAAQQGLVTQYSLEDAAGIALLLDKTGKPRVYLGDGVAYDTKRWCTGTEQLKTMMEQKEKGEEDWYHVVAVWDGSQVTLWLNGDQQHFKETGKQEFSLSGPVRPGSAPLRLGACGEGGYTSNLLNGDLAMPVIYAWALSQTEIEERYSDKAQTPPANRDPDSEVLACWPLTEEQGTKVADVSDHKRDGQIINGGTWMIGGPKFDGTKVQRFEHYDPAKDSLRGHALRLASDDLYDCKWDITHRVNLPTTPPGLYSGRFFFGENFKSIYDVTFVVRKAPAEPKRDILVLCATNTWLAYNATPFAPNQTTPGPDTRDWPTNGIGDSSRPRFNFYQNHKTGQPTYKVGLHVPWPVAAPYVTYQDSNYSHLVRAERFLHYWLDQNGYAYDVTTDLDVQSDPQVFDGYRVVVVNGHSEYWSTTGYERLESFLRKGGKVISLSGNTLCWRVSFDKDMTAMECRKVAGTSTLAGGRENSNFGEGYHSDDRQRGGLMRDCGYPAWSLLGLESTGLSGPCADRTFICDAPTSVAFKDTNLEQGTSFGKGALGHEWDVRVSLPQQGIAPFTPESEQDVVYPYGDTAGMTVLAHSNADLNWDSVFDYYLRPLKQKDFKPDQSDGSTITYHGLKIHVRCSEIILWDRPMGGWVFNVGAIGAGWGLRDDSPSEPSPYGTMLRNVLKNFLGS